MSVKGRTYPYRIVLHHGDAKPSTHVVQGDRDSAENRAAEVQAHGTRADVLLVQGDLRTVITTHPAADFDPDYDPDGRSYFVRYHLPVTADGVTAIEHGIVTAEAGRSLFESDARRAARAFQRAGGSAEIVRGNTVSSVYPALTGQALAGVAEPTTDERLDARGVSRSRVKFERTRHAADCVRLNLTLLCDLEPHTVDTGGVRTANCVDNRPEPKPVPRAAGGYRYTLATCPGYLQAAVGAAWCARCGIRETEHEQREWELDVQRLAELKTGGPLSQQLRALAAAEVAADSPGCGAETYEDVEPTAVERWEADEAERAASAVNLLAAGRTLVDLRRVLDRGADDAETALGGELGRVTSAVLRFVADLGEPADNLAREQVRLLARLGELVTERALAHREFSRGGPDRRDIDKAALNAYSDRFEPSRHEVRDHQAAMVDAVDAVFDAVAQGLRRALMHPSHGHHVVAVRAKDGQHDDGYPWMTSHGGYYRDRDVEGWLELAPTGRVFKPESGEGR